MFITGRQKLVRHAVGIDLARCVTGVRASVGVGEVAEHRIEATVLLEDHDDMADLRQGIRGGGKG